MTTETRESDLRGSATWAVAVDRADSPNSMDRGVRVCSCLNDIGISAYLVEDGDPKGFQAEVLLLMENPADFHCYPHQLEQLGAERPFTITWMMETLPPCGLSRDRVKEGLKAAGWKRGLGLWDRDTLHKRKLHRFFYRSLSTLLHRRVLSGMRQDGLSLDGDAWKQVRGAFENWEFLHRALHTGWLDHCIVSTQQRQKFLAEQGWAADFAPVGWHEGLGKLMDLERDVDVLFLGHLRRDRRRDRLRWIEGELRKLGISIHVVTGACYGEDRTKLLNRTRILLMFHQYSWSPAWIRFVLGAACGACVVSEHGMDKEPFQEGKHYLSGCLKDMPQLIAGLLRDERRRAQIAAAAHQHCITHVTLEKSVRTIVESVTQRSKSKIQCETNADV